MKTIYEKPLLEVVRMEAQHLLENSGETDDYMSKDNDMWENDDVETSVFGQKGLWED